MKASKLLGNRFNIFGVIHFKNLILTKYYNDYDLGWKLDESCRCGWERIFDIWWVQEEFETSNRIQFQWNLSLDHNLFLDISIYIHKIATCKTLTFIFYKRWMQVYFFQIDFVSKIEYTSLLIAWCPSITNHKY